MSLEGGPEQPGHGSAGSRSAESGSAGPGSAESGSAGPGSAESGSAGPGSAESGLAASWRSQPDLRTLSDARTLRALAHPVRVALIEALILHGPMTATQVGEQIGESPTTCSFHLRQLAKYGFVEEAGGGKGRARPWRMTSIGFSIAVPEGQPEAELAGVIVARMFRDRQFERYRTWLETKGSYPARWRKAAFDGEYLLYLTPDELEQINVDLHAGLYERMHERLADPSKRPPGALPVEMVVFSYPMSYPDSEPTEQADGESGS